MQMHLQPNNEKYNIFLEYVVRNVTKPIKWYKQQHKKENCILLVDNRPNVMDVASVYLTMNNLNPDKWDIVFIGSQVSLDYFRSHFNDIPQYIRDNRLDKTHFDIELYNEIMKDSKTWQSLKDYKKCLVIQDDGMLIKKGMEEHFLSYDYIGSPWAKCVANKQIEDLTNGSLVGNGGMSLRDVKLSLKACEEYGTTDGMLLFNSELQPIPEDVFFCRCIQKLGGNIPNYKDACLFGSEQVLVNASLGFHKMWMYHELQQVQEFFENNNVLLSTN